MPLSWIKSKVFDDNSNWPCCVVVMVIISSNITVVPGLVLTFMSVSKSCVIL